MLLFLTNITVFRFNRRFTTDPDKVKERSGKLNKSLLSDIRAFLLRLDTIIMGRFGVGQWHSLFINEGYSSIVTNWLPHNYSYSHAPWIPKLKRSSYGGYGTNTSQLL